VSPQVATPIRAAVKPQVPFLDLKAQFAGIRADVMAAVEKVLDSQHFILGPEVQKLEDELADYLGVQHAIGCASGSDALLLALMALEVGPGDEVITTPFTFGATAGSVARLGAKPVFVDIDPETYNLDVQQIAAAITPRTRALMPVHLFGLAAPMDAVLRIAREHNLPVIEDAAQAIGAWFRGKSIGGLGTIGCFSFFPSKNLGGAGDGGMVTTNDAQIAERLKILRVHGCRTKYEYEMLGMNSRLDAVQAAILRVKLRHLTRWSEARRRNAARYAELFREFQLDGRMQLPVEPSGHVHVYNQYVIRVADRDALREHLRRAGIPTEIYYPAPLHTQAAFASLGYKAGDFPHAEAAAQQTLALPIFAELTEAQQRAVVESIASFYELSATRHELTHMAA
jgi:dTDP-4-amino-4,6-dideoxygalactose transaminase